MIPPVFDAHCHIINPRFALKATRDLPTDVFGAADYLAVARPLGIIAGAVVSQSYHGFDQGYLLDALRRLGAGYVGVTQLPVSVTDAELATLNGFGVRGVRFTLRGETSGQLAQIESMAHRLYRRVGWHCELNVAPQDLPDLEPWLLRLPRLCIDYLDQRQDNLHSLLRLAKKGVKIKACGFERLGFPAAEALKEISAASPHALMFGTDLPSSCNEHDSRARDIVLIQDTLSERAAQQVLWDNATAFYCL